MGFIHVIAIASMLLVGCGQQEPNASKSETQAAKIALNKNKEDVRYENFKSKYGGYSIDDAEWLLKRDLDNTEFKDADLANRFLAEIAKKRQRDIEKIKAKESKADESCKGIGATVPKNFIFTNIHNIIELRKAAQFKPKDDFETTAQYGERINREGQALGVNVQCIEGGQPSYDADNQGWKIYLSTRYDYNGSYYVTDYNFISQDEYVGKNAFGTETTVLKSVRSYVGVFFNGKSLDNALKRLPMTDNSIFIKMKIDEAKKTKPQNIGVIIQYRWDPEKLMEFDENKTASIDSPTEDIRSYTLINGKIMNVIIYNRETGDILAQSYKK